MVGKGRPKTRIFTRMSGPTSNMLTIATVLLVFFIIRRRRRWYQRNKIERILQARQEDYDSLLSHYNPYYKSLSSEGRDRFLKRLLVFIQSKRYEYIDLEAQERTDIPTAPRQPPMKAMSARTASTFHGLTSCANSPITPTARTSASMRWHMRSRM
jgi:hypothetical protein